MRMTCLARIQRPCLQRGQVRVRMQQRPYCLPRIYRVGNDLTFIAGLTRDQFCGHANELYLVRRVMDLHG